MLGKRQDIPVVFVCVDNVSMNRAVKGRRAAACAHASPSAQLVPRGSILTRSSPLRRRSSCVGAPVSESTEMGMRAFHDAAPIASVASVKSASAMGAKSRKNHPAASSFSRVGCPVRASGKPISWFPGTTTAGHAASEDLGRSGRSLARRSTWSPVHRLTHRCWSLCQSA